MLPYSANFTLVHLGELLINTELTVLCSVTLVNIVNMAILLLLLLDNGYS